MERNDLTRVHAIEGHTRDWGLSACRPARGGVHARAGLRRVHSPSEGDDATAFFLGSSTPVVGITGMHVGIEERRRGRGPEPEVEASKQPPTRTKDAYRSAGKPNRRALAPS